MLKSFLKDYVFKENKETEVVKSHPHFFIFANKQSYSRGLEDYLTTHKEIDNSIFVFFNMGEPFKHSEIARSHKRKWIFFRSIRKSGNQFDYRNLELLKEYDFEKIFVIPDILTTKNISSQPTKRFIEFIEANNINAKAISHIGPDSQQPKDYHELNERLNRDKKKPYYQDKFLSSGTWIYIYLRAAYPESGITLIGFTSRIDPVIHEPSVERKFLILESLERKCDMFDYMD